MTIEFPCAVHGNDYDTIKIAVDEKDLAVLHAEGWLTSQEWYSKHLNVVELETIKETPKRGRPPKQLSD